MHRDDRCFFKFGHLTKNYKSWCTASKFSFAISRSVHGSRNYKNALEITLTKAGKTQRVNNMEYE